LQSADSLHWSDVAECLGVTEEVVKPVCGAAGGTTAHPAGTNGNDRSYYDEFLDLSLTRRQKADLVEYLKSL
jgi:hypothetical protein